MDFQLRTMSFVKLICGSFAFALLQPASAATLCVNPGGSSGCYSSINAAIQAANPSDTVNVAAGVYKEAVIISKSISLVGEEGAIINAKGKPVGITINGMNTSGLSHVVVFGFVVRNANFEGILVLNASNVTIANNRVVDNNEALDISTPACPGLPDFETSESEDCGEGIHLIAADHSIVAHNVVVRNSGGILLSDETGPTHDNLIADNKVKNNPFDCGITLAGHPPATGTGSPFGVYRNTVTRNESVENGTQVPGAGAGVGIFGFLPGVKNYGNVVIGNVMRDNGLPGFAMHAHSPGENFDDTLIVGNFIAGNGADTADAATPGPTGINVFGVSSISGMVISQNTIRKEDVDIVIHTPAIVDVHLNNLLGRHIGIDNLGTETVNATENWWGCPDGPTSSACSNVSGDVVFTPWLTEPLFSRDDK
ncbi:MAG: right-handed parallel beta-helix repeat-containing protein [Acidobacteriaceae bacterium]|nr:right-handed parallel beta-helix repeat-containing protein [Acidobacteriaceae bacterium]